MNSIVLYTNGNQECERARMLLKKLNTQIQEYKLNNHLFPLIASRYFLINVLFLAAFFNSS